MAAKVLETTLVKKKPQWVPVRRDSTFYAGLVLLLFWVAVMVVGPGLIQGDPYANDSTVAQRAPSAEYPFGTDKFGRDVYARVVHGSRYDMLMALASVGIAFAVGLLLGGLSGFLGGRVDNAIMRGVELILAFPSFVLALVFTAVMGASLGTIIIALAIVFVPIYARLIRGEILAEKEKQYALAAQAIGCSGPRIILRHLLPNIMPPVITQTTMNLAWMILIAAGLSFIGTGIQPPSPEWGVMINEGAPFIISGNWWMSFFPGIALLSMSGGFILLGDGMGGRPRQRK